MVSRSPLRYESVTSVTESPASNPQVPLLQDVEREVADEKRPGRKRKVTEMEYLYEPELEGAPGHAILCLSQQHELVCHRSPRSACGVGITQTVTQAAAADAPPLGVTERRPVRLLNYGTSACWAVQADPARVGPARRSIAGCDHGVGTRQVTSHHLTLSRRKPKNHVAQRPMRLTC